MHPVWTLNAFDRQGNVIGTISREPGGPVTIDGTPDAFALCIPDLLHLPAFFTDPRSIAKQAYDAHRAHCMATFPDAVELFPTWETMIADPVYQSTVRQWEVIAIAASRAKPDLT